MNKNKTENIPSFEEVQETEKRLLELKNQLDEVKKEAARLKTARFQQLKKDYPDWIDLIKGAINISNNLYYSGKFEDFISIYLENEVIGTISASEINQIRDK